MEVSSKRLMHFAGTAYVIPDGCDSRDSRVSFTTTLLITPATRPLESSNTGLPLWPGAAHAGQSGFLHVHPFTVR